MPLPPNPSSPARVSGGAGPLAIDAAGPDRRWLRIGIVIFVAIVAVPGLIIIALARLQGERR